ncbi:glutathione hydrolase 3-like isoform X2 [Macadamia integrifolia]|uniref:glutathione hydrolase 3-like isoform X2 n=1 Tax=Macadamia integrifolia TaxID=60698 RepID=UPI001C52E40B|nr:glutathione hydrolase 3-like isoform X2 [Macadamia integrifolia]
MSQRERMESLALSLGFASADKLMMDQQQRMEVTLLGDPATANRKKSTRRAAWLFVAVLTFIGLVVYKGPAYWGLRQEKYEQRGEANDVAESEHGVVAADDGRCSDIGVSVLRDGGHAVDAAVATALCLGVVNPMSSGIGGGAFMVVRSSATSQADAFDMRETAPLAASKDMYENNPQAKYIGALSMGVPGEIAGLHESWSKYGRLAWKALFQPAIQLARDGFVVAPYLGRAIKVSEELIMSDPGLRKVFAPNGQLLKAGDTCYNVELGHTLEAVAEYGPEVFYSGTIGENFVRDVGQVGGILTMEDLRHYKVEKTDAMAFNAMGYTILGMPPPSSGTPGLALVLDILDSYGSSDAIKGPLGLHHLIEAMKHMFALRMNLGDPNFVNVTECITDMLSPSLAKSLQQKIFDNTTFPPDYYMNRYELTNENSVKHTKGIQFCIS